MNRRGMLFWVALAVVLVGFGAFYGGRTSSGEPFAPDSTDPLGTRALMEFLDRLGPGFVEGELPGDDVGTTLLLTDRLQPAQRDELEAWVEAGGTLVVSDPGSAFGPGLFGTAGSGFDDSGARPSGRCTIPGLDGLTVEASSLIVFPTEDADAVCFADDDGAFVHERRLGRGRIVALGGGLILTNGDLDEADNAVVMAELLLADEQPVTVLFEPIVTAGSKSLIELIPSGAKWATWQLLVALGIYLAWRVRRFGRPVPESQPVELPGSLLVRAAGELHRRSGGHSRAADRLRDDLRRRVRRHLRIAPDVGDDELIRHTVAEFDLPMHVAARALGHERIDGAAELTSLVVEVDTVAAAVLVDPDRPNEPLAVGGPT